MAKEETILYGKNSVRERLRSHPQSIRRVAVTQDFPHEDIKKLLHEKGVTVTRHTAKEFARLRPQKDLQGIIAYVEKYRYAALGDILSSPGTTPVFCDRINDPQNLGVILRVLACFGRFAVVIPEFKSCEVNETVLHVASGAENYVPVARVANLTQALLAAKKAGFWAMGAVVEPEAQDLTALSLPFPLALVLGSEGQGVRYGIDKHLDIRARIPMAGAALSFNVAMACAIFGYEIQRQRKGSS
ncbi:MAG: TrmH family RNA methyltransferase [Deltaproteobacteria bacterium]